MMSMPQSPVDAAYKHLEMCLKAFHTTLIKISEYKADARARIAKKEYKIIANVGDMLSDLVRLPPKQVGKMFTEIGCHR